MGSQWAKRPSPIDSLQWVPVCTRGSDIPPEDVIQLTHKGHERVGHPQLTVVVSDSAHKVLTYMQHWHDNW